MPESDESELEAYHCEVCGKDLTDPKNAGDLDEDGDWVCRSISCRAAHPVEMTVTLDDGNDGEKTPVEVWEANNDSFSYDPPQKPGDLWSSEEYQELHDRFIQRRVEWTCQKCSGRGPIGSLRKARSHVESQHGQDLIGKYETPREEYEKATDGGTAPSEVEKRQSENRGLGDFE